MGSEQPNDIWRVFNLVNESGNWDWSHLRSFLPDPIVMQIASVLLRSLDARNDQLSWRWALRSFFSTVETYKVMHQTPQIRSD